MRGHLHLVVVSALIGIIQQQILYWIVFIWFMCLYLQKRMTKETIGLLALVIMFFTYFYTADHDVVKNGINDPPYIKGKIMTEVDYKEEHISFVIKEDKTSKKTLVNYFFKSDQDVLFFAAPSSWKTGATCKINGERGSPRESTNPGQFNYQQYLMKQGISSQVTISNVSDITCSGTSFRGEVFSFRQNVMQNATIDLSDSTRGWLHALLLGDTSRIDQSTIELFRRWNMSHLLAISGMHISVLVGFMYFLIVRLGWCTKRSAAYVLFILLLFYPMLAGGSPSVWRASMMTGLAFLIRKKIAVLDLLSIVFLIFVLADKTAIHHLGFQFSFIVTYALLLSRPFLRRCKYKLVLMFAISCISMLAILPIQLNQFYSFNPLSVFLNLFAVPYFSFFVLPFLFITFLLLVFLPPLFPLFDRIFDHVHNNVLSIFVIVDEYLYYPLIIGEIPLHFTILFYVCFIGFMMSLINFKRSKAVCRGTLLFVIILLFNIRPYLNPYGVVTMLDVGQGDALVIELPFRQGVIIYDLAGTTSSDFQTLSDRLFKQTIEPYLHSRGIRRIDALILSHEHVDHYGSTPYLLDNFIVDTLITSDFFIMPEELDEIISQKQLSILNVKGNDELKIGDYVFTVLSPSFDWGSANDNSLVLKTELGSLTWLLTGDIEEDVEKWLVKTYPNLSVDVLSVAHHGSSTSSSEAFVKHIDPLIALISVGRNNRYQHPDQRVIERLTHNNVVIYRTDQHGAVSYFFNPYSNRVTFLPFLP